MRGRIPVPPTFRRVEIPLVLGAFLGLRSLEVIAPVPWWVMVPVLLGVGLLSDLAGQLWPKPRTSGALWLRTGILAAGITTVMYLTGWGPTLAVGYAWLVGESVGWAGWRACRPAVVCSLTCLLLGEVAIGVGIAPTLIDTPDVHGLAVLSGLGLAIMVGVVARSKRAEEEANEDLRRRKERFRALLENAADAIVAFREDGTTTYVSPAFERLVGSTQPESAFVLSGDLVHPDDQERTRQLFATVVTEPTRPHWAEIRLRDEGGDWHWFEVWVTNRLDDPSVGGIVANLHDITERKLFEERLAFQAFHDDLTGLPNRSAFLERLQSTLDHPVNRRRVHAVLFLDVDRLKLVNDSLGHEIGDRVLVEVGRRMRSLVRPTDIVARFGGDEFAVLLTDLDAPDEASRVAGRILDALRSPVVVAGRELLATGSIGISVTNAADVHTSDLLRQADLAMYVAKERGRSRFEFYDPRQVPPVVERLELEGALWKAVDGDELVVYFQPEVTLADTEVVAVEALVRWDHPERGILGPDAFVPFAEESNLIVAIDRFVLREACLQAADWRRRGVGNQPLTVSVNLSPRFVHQPDAVPDILAVLAEAGADPHTLQLEITERTALADQTRTVRTLRQLRERGIRVAIDDFGTGYSSLGYLRQFPVDVLKLDKSFVDGIGDGRGGAAIVEAVITMGHALGMRITAEGVERPEQAAELRALGCDAAQGFHFARPLARGALEELLTETGTLGATVLPLPLTRRDAAS